MSLQKINTRNTVLILMIIAAAAMRLVIYKIAQSYPMEMSNFTPFGAIALFSGVYFSDKWKAFGVTFGSLFLSDIPINYFYTNKVVLFNSGSIWLYVVFGLMIIVSSFIKKVNIVSIGFASIVGVAIHWLLMDLPWLYGSMYPHTLIGYKQSLIAALPFERNMLAADIIFGTILFGGFELAKSKYAVLQGRKQLAL